MKTNRYKKSNKKRNNNYNVSLRRDPFLGAIQQRHITINVPVYMVSSSLGYLGYSFSSSTSQASGTYFVQLSTLIAADTEYISLAQTYSLAALASAKIKVTNTQNPSGSLSTFTSYPALSLDIIPYYISLSQSATCDSDTRLDVNINNTNKLMHKSYPFKHLVQSSAGYPVCGGSSFFYPGSYSSANLLFLVLGFRNAPTNASTQVLQVVELEIDFVFNCAKIMKTA
jgi:hypothetical protein